MHIDPDYAAAALKLVVGHPLPVIEDEVHALTSEFGAPVRRSFALPADSGVRTWRFGDRGDRRAEVVFAIQDPRGGVWLHTKRHYPKSLYRLPSGGVNWQEPVRDALFREMREETGLSVQVERFLGLLEYSFMDAGRVAPFASYVFLVRSEGGTPIPIDDDEIAGFRLANAAQLFHMAREVRRLSATRSGCSAWRALALDLVFEMLTQGDYPDC